MRSANLSRKLTARNAALFALSATGILLIQPAQSAVQVSFIDLHPSGATSSEIRAINATRQGGSATFNGDKHAGMWSGTPGNFVDLHPASGPVKSTIYGLGDTTQAGLASYDVGGFDVSQPAIWFGSADSFVNLSPSPGDPYSQGSARAGNDTQQAGDYMSPADPNIRWAALWSGTAGSLVYLHPAGASLSSASGLGGAQQVGYVRFSAYHAALWEGTADSFVDLHPAGASASLAYATTGTQQAGVATFGTLHAALWTGTVASFVDLHPTGAISSAAEAIYGTQQAGLAKIGGVNHAALWSGTAGSFVDLHGALGGGYSSSSAYAIYSSGDTTYVGGKAGSHAILWTIRFIPGTPLLICGKPRAGATNITTLTWTNAGVACRVESAPALTGSWSTVSSPRTTNGQWVSTTVSNTASAQFFRLRN